MKKHTQIHIKFNSFSHHYKRLRYINSLLVNLIEIHIDSHFEVHQYCRGMSDQDITISQISPLLFHQKHLFAYYIFPQDLSLMWYLRIILDHIYLK